MANFKLYFPKLLQYEGGYVENVHDKGGPTKYGITLKEWQTHGKDLNGDGHIDKEDVKLIAVSDALKIAKPEYWDVVHADKIDSQPIAELIVDWSYTSGTSNVIKRVQRILGLADDGVVGPHTIEAINNTGDPEALFYLIRIVRANFYKSIVTQNPSQAIFLKGWLNRTNQFVYK